MLDEDLREGPWQKWFQANSWVLGSLFVRIVDERHIDTQHMSDFLMEAYDGFLDVVEIKRPNGSLNFWAPGLDNGNYRLQPPTSISLFQLTAATRTGGPTE